MQESTREDTGTVNCQDNEDPSQIEMNKKVYENESEFDTIEADKSYNQTLKSTRIEPFISEVPSICSSRNNGKVNESMLSLNQNVEEQQKAISDNISYNMEHLKEFSSSTQETQDQIKQNTQQPESPSKQIRRKVFSNSENFNDRQPQNCSINHTEQVNPQNINFSAFQNNKSLSVNYQNNKMFDFEAKRNRFLFLKNWNDKTKTQIQIYYGIITNLGNFICILQNEANTTTNQMVKYFKDRVKQDTKFATSQTIKMSKIYQKILELQEKPHKKQNIEKVGQLLEKVDIISRNNSLSQEFLQKKPKFTYPDFYSILKELDRQEVKTNQIIIKFAQYVENVIIKEKMLGNYKEYEKNLQNFIQSYKRKKAEIAELQKNEQEKYRAYSTLFGEMAKAQRKKKMVKKDLLFSEMEYLYFSARQFEVIKDLGQEIFKQLKTLKELETQRLKDIQDSAMIYDEKFREVFRFQNTNDEVQDEESEKKTQQVKAPHTDKISFDNTQNIRKSKKIVEQSQQQPETPLKKETIYDFLSQAHGGIKQYNQIYQEINMTFSIDNLLSKEHISYLTKFCLQHRNNNIKNNKSNNKLNKVQEIDEGQEEDLMAHKSEKLEKKTQNNMIGSLAANYNESYEFKLEQLKYFIENFNLMQIPSSPLLISEFRVSKLQEFLDGEGQDIDIFHTADNYLIISEGLFDNNRKPLNLIPIEKSIFNNEGDNGVFQIVYTKKYLFCISKKTVYTFQAADYDKQQIQQIINNEAIGMNKPQEENKVSYDQNETLASLNIDSFQSDRNQDLTIKLDKTN